MTTSKFEKRVTLFKQLIERGSIRMNKEYSKQMIEEIPTVLADMSFDLSDEVLSMLVWESYFTYKPEIRKQDLCINAGKKCVKCHEPECNLAKGWMRKLYHCVECNHGHWTTSKIGREHWKFRLR